MEGFAVWVEFSRPASECCSGFYSTNTPTTATTTFQLSFSFTQHWLSSILPSTMDAMGINTDDDIDSDSTSNTDSSSNEGTSTMDLYNHCAKILDEKERLENKIKKLKSRNTDLKAEISYIQDQYDTLQVENYCLAADLRNCKVWQKREMLEEERRSSSNDGVDGLCLNWSPSRSNPVRASPSQAGIHDKKFKLGFKVGCPCCYTY